MNNLFSKLLIFPFISLQLKTVLLLNAFIISKLVVGYMSEYSCSELICSHFPEKYL